MELRFLTAKKNMHPKSSAMHHLKWKESAEILTSKVFP
jgi:hypothetical protein